MELQGNLLNVNMVCICLLPKQLNFNKPSKQLALKWEFSKDQDATSLYVESFNVSNVSNKQENRGSNTLWY